MNQYTDSAPQSQHPNVKNWQDIDTSTPQRLWALDRVIAARLGWRFDYSDYLMTGVYFIYTPTGMQCGHHNTSAKYTTAFVQDESSHVVPHYSTDLNHAFELANAQTHIRTRRGKQDEQIWGVELNLRDETYQDTSLAVAICKAWLGWHDWKEALLARIAAEDTEAHDANGRGAV